MKIDFSFESKYGIFKDAITLDDEIEYDPDEIQKMKEDRFKAWIEMLETPREMIVETTYVSIIEEEQLNG